MKEYSSKFKDCIQAIDSLNKKDKNTINNEPKEFINSCRMTEMLAEVYPYSSEELSIAARAFHLERWIIPRNEYSMDRVGYLSWRSKLKEHHANKTAEIMDKLGYEDVNINHIKEIILRKFLKTNENAQKLEDIASLVFLKYDLASFSKKHSEEKCISILQKTWGKMSDKAHTFALQITYTDEALSLIKKALS